MYVAFNSHDHPVTATLPPPMAGKKWARLVDTNRPPGRDYVKGGNAGVEPVYSFHDRSAVVLISKDVT